MVIDVRPILHTPGKRLDFQFELDLSDLEFDGRNPLSRPVTVEGEVRNTADLLELALTAETETEYHCMLAEELQNGESDEIVLLEDGKVDAGDLARTAFILDMDSKTLCSEDCKGLCPRCGADWNLGPCSCKREPDPRLAALASLLENK